MRCFQSDNGEKRNDLITTSTTRSSMPHLSSSASTSTDDFRRLDSAFGSQNVSDMSAGSSSKTPSRKHLRCPTQKSNNLRVFTLSELKTATKNFNQLLMIGEGGFGCVYRARINSSEDSRAKIDVAIKQLGKRGLQGHKEWVTEVNVLGVVDHKNLVKLVGYCNEDDERGIQRILVYEFMKNRSVEDHLTNKSTKALSWSMRLKIAEDAACGLAYLHEEMDFQIIFRDFKSSNILLDDQWNAKLSDFGLAREGPTEGASHVSTAIVGTLGYAAPEYIQTGRLTTKNDVYSYGVFLYELITGRRPLDRNRPRGEQNLIEWVRPYLTDIKKFEQILDPRMEGKYNLRSAMKLAAVANRCMSRQPRVRPKMSEVLEKVKLIVEGKEIIGSTPNEIPPLPQKSFDPNDPSVEGEHNSNSPTSKTSLSTITDSCLSCMKFWSPKIVQVS
ncbi:hypothetical protein C5167_001129 [Papaver somniferum]|uniref:non-specific serine/threonine protein kinase n=1 Tax=Papaver somniferum TaxID=3469 RepID=A0A4Y7KYI1_PAPSO|nr:serine/threonine-protein kinase PCRK1-like [Papaver somniferum]XP_026418058.1 serine/threonine-protein kinase PCRK1-like [Papaver somniferum]RZC76985.1 hypothetical protein C5167_001129 [Papaver somniferum]